MKKSLCILLLMLMLLGCTPGVTQAQKDEFIALLQTVNEIEDIVNGYGLPSEAAEGYSSTSMVESPEWNPDYYQYEGFFPVDDCGFSSKQDIRDFICTAFTRDGVTQYFLPLYSDHRYREIDGKLFVLKSDPSVDYIQWGLAGQTFYDYTPNAYGFTVLCDYPHGSGEELETALFFVVNTEDGLRIADIQFHFRQYLS